MGVTQIERVKLLDSDLPKCVLSGPLSRTTSYALHMTGPVHPKEFDNLIRVLELYRDWLKQDEVEPPPEA
jgi:hypothetical protein